MTAILEKQINTEKQYSRCNCILLDGIPECKGEVIDVTAKIIYENIKQNIIAVDIGRSCRIWIYHLQKKNERPVIVKFAQYNVRERVFSNKFKLKRKKISISESLTKLHLMKLKEARDHYTFPNVWKIMFKDDNKVKVYLN